MKTIIGDVTLISGKYDTVFVIRRSPISGRLYSVNIGGVSIQDLESFFRNRATEKRLIKDIFPFMSSPDREFLLTGIPPAEWDAKIATTEDEEDHD